MNNYFQSSINNVNYTHLINTYNSIPIYTVQFVYEHVMFILCVSFVNQTNNEIPYFK